MVRRNIMLDEDLDKELSIVAAQFGSKRSAILGKALSFYLDHLDLVTAKERAARHEAGEDPGLSVAEVRKKLGL